jgi:cytochrome b561
MMILIPPQEQRLMAAAAAAMHLLLLLLLLLVAKVSSLIAKYNHLMETFHLEAECGKGGLCTRGTTSHTF